MFLAPYYWGFSFIEVQGPQQEMQGPPVNTKYVQGPQNIWPLHMSKWPLHKFYIYTLMTCDVQSACGNKYKCVALHVHLHAHSHLHARLHSHSHAHSQKLSQLMLCLIVINWVMYGYVSFPSNSHRHENWSWDCYLVDRVQKVGEENDIWK